MPNITYFPASGTCRVVDAASGISVMQAALNHRVDGILDECSENCICAIRYVYMDTFLDRIPLAKENEKFMLSIAAERPETDSRLSCQIEMTEDIDGIVVRLPRKQK